MKRLATVCDGCGKKVLHDRHDASVDMIMFNGELLFLGDMGSGESCRPTLSTEQQGVKSFCPDCFLKWVVAWVEKLKCRPPSKILAADIFYPAVNE